MTNEPWAMDVFSLRDTVVSEYRKLATSFTTIHAEDIRQQVEAIYAKERKALKLAIADQEDEGRKRASILNLNHPALVAARQAASLGEQDRLRRDLKGKSATEEERRARARAMLEGGAFREFVSIRMAYLNRMLGKHREPTHG